MMNINYKLQSKWSTTSLLTFMLLLAPIVGFSQNKERVITITPDIQLTKLNDSFYIHTSWYNYPGFGRVACNGLIFAKNSEAILIDTPNDNQQTETLIRFLQDSLKISTSKVIVGHSHNDCLGGLEYLHQEKIESISGSKTQEICKTQKLPVPLIAFQQKLTMNFHGEKIICRYFGGGHTIDNIVVYFPESAILFGGCLIKSMNSKSLGYVGEADLTSWDATVELIQKAYPQIKLVIPGHGKHGDSQLLTHTINLVRQNRK